MINSPLNNSLIERLAFNAYAQHTSQVEQLIKALQHNPEYSIEELARRLGCVPLTAEDRTEIYLATGRRD